MIISFMLQFLYAAFVVLFGIFIGMIIVLRNLGYKKKELISAILNLPILFVYTMAINGRLAYRQTKVFKGNKSVPSILLYCTRVFLHLVRLSIRRFPGNLFDITQKSVIVHNKNRIQNEVKISVLCDCSFARKVIKGRNMMKLSKIGTILSDWNGMKSENQVRAD